MASKTKSSRPPLACEITGEHVVAARAGQNVVESLTVRSLPAGTVTPSLANPNVVNGTALRQALGEAFDAVGAHVRDVSVVVPDATARLMLLDFETFPERAQEAEPLVRFRLKKLLPFDSDHAALSLHAFRNGAGVKVAATVAMRSVVEEYEAALRDIGFNPGVVLPSLAATLGLVEAPQPTLVIKADRGTTSVAIVDGEALRLVRVLDTGRAAPASAEELADDVYPLLVFYQDTYGASIQRILVSGAAPIDKLRPLLEQQGGARVQELVTSTSFAGSYSSGNLPRGMLAGVLGALA